MHRATFEIRYAASECALSRNLRALFFFFRRRQAAIVFYVAVGTRQSVPYFEVRCSSLSVQLVLESPTGETYRTAWQPQNCREEKGGGRRAVFFLESTFFSP